MIVNIFHTGHIEATAVSQHPLTYDAFAFLSNLAPPSRRVLGLLAPFLSVPLTWLPRRRTSLHEKSIPSWNVPYQAFRANNLC